MASLARVAWLVSKIAKRKNAPDLHQLIVFMANGANGEHVLSAVDRGTGFAVSCGKRATVGSHAKSKP